MAVLNPEEKTWRKIRIISDDIPFLLEESDGSTDTDTDSSISTSSNASNQSNQSNQSEDMCLITDRKYRRRQSISTPDFLNENVSYENQISKSWNSTYDTNIPKKKEPKKKLPFYNPILNCKSAGIIPYTIVDDVVYFLLQKADSPYKKKESGWNDFGGKKIYLNETTTQVAAREFSEETSCLFYIKEKAHEMHYEIFRNHGDIYYLDRNPSHIDTLNKNITLATKYYDEKINKYPVPLNVSSKETYISYFLRVPYIPDTDLPGAEDLHINYKIRYTRKCKWFSFDDIILLSETDFHKRLQITKVQNRIKSYHEKHLFS